MKHKNKHVLLLIFLILTAGLVTHGQSMKEQPKREAGKSLYTDTPEKTTETGQRRSIPRGESVRENPFRPLITEYTVRSDENSVKAAELPVSAKAAEDSANTDQTIRLTAIINKTIAIFDEGNVSKLVTIGDKIAGMKLESIQTDKVILDNGKKYEVMLGGSPSEIKQLPVNKLYSGNQNRYKTKPDPDNKAYQFTIQVGSYKSRYKALNCVNMVQKLGYDACIYKVMVPGKGVCHRVFAGKYVNKDESIKALHDLRKVKLFAKAYIVLLSKDFSDLFGGNSYKEVTPIKMKAYMVD